MLVLLVLSVSGGIVYADPRMETNDDFCHFIFDADNGDNETFVAGCGSQIMVKDGVAYGYARVSQLFGKFKPFHPKKNIYITSDQSNQVCTMVESNGTVYESNEWKTMTRIRGRKVVHEIICRNGQQQ